LVEQPEGRERRTVARVDRSAQSLNPSPDCYMGTRLRVDFMEAVRSVCASAVLQAMGRGNYSESARKNRERISRDAQERAAGVALLSRGRNVKRAMGRAA
jgi:hypothetical protein